MELFVYYILPNIVLFGSIFVVAKTAEHSAWYMIENYNEIVGQLENYFVDSNKK